MSHLMTPSRPRNQAAPSTPMTGAHAPHGSPSRSAAGAAPHQSPQSMQRSMNSLNGIAEAHHACRENIHTVVRIRPDLDGHQAGTQQSQKAVWAHEDGKHITISEKGPQYEGARTYKYDHVFGPNATQLDLYSVAERFVSASMNGFNGTIFAYGQTGSGKTYTMLGPTSELLKEHSSSRGLIPQLLSAMFSRVNERMANESCQIEISVEALEIYKENVRDLLPANGSVWPPESGASLTVKSEPFIYVAGLNRQPVKTSAEACALLLKASSARKTGATNMNEHSSRSHSVFTLNIATTYKINNSRSTSRLNLVDLAGSESQKQAQTSGDRLKEAGKINQSLSALTTYIGNLSKGDRSYSHRNSKLTHLLSDSIGGNSITTVIATINPQSDVFSESMSTLNFASQAKTIRSDAKQNLMVDGQRVDSEALLASLSEKTALVKKKDEDYAELEERHLSYRNEMDLSLLARLDESLLQAAVSEQLITISKTEDQSRSEAFDEALEWNAILEEQVQVLQNEVEEQQDFVQQSHQRSRQALENKNNKIVRLEQEVSILTQTIQGLRTDSMKRENELSNKAVLTQTELQEIQNNLAKRTNDYATLQQEYAQLKKEYESGQNQLETAQDTISSSQSTISQLESRLASTETTAQQQQSDLLTESTRAKKAYMESKDLISQLTAALKKEHAAFREYREKVEKEREELIRQQQEEADEAQKQAELIQQFEQDLAARDFSQDKENTSPNIVADSEWIVPNIAIPTNELKEFMAGLALKPYGGKIGTFVPLSTPLKANSTRNPAATPPTQTLSGIKKSNRTPSTQSKRISGSAIHWSKVIEPIEKIYDPIKDLGGEMDSVKVETVKSTATTIQEEENSENVDRSNINVNQQQQKIESSPTQKRVVASPIMM